MVGRRGLANGPFATLLGVEFLLREEVDVGRWDRGRLWATRACSRSQETGDRAMRTADLRRRISASVAGFSSGQNIRGQDWLRRACPISRHIRHRAYVDTLAVQMSATLWKTLSNERRLRFVRRRSPLKLGDSIRGRAPLMATVPQRSSGPAGLSRRRIRAATASTL